MFLNHNRTSCDTSNVTKKSHKLKTLTKDSKYVNLKIIQSYRTWKVERSFQWVNVSLSFHVKTTCFFSAAQPCRVHGCCKRASSLQQHKQANSFGLFLGVFVYRSDKGLSHEGGNRQIGHILWTTGTIEAEEDCRTGGAVERPSRQSSTDVNLEIRGNALVTG